ncbi:hypothetical protein RFZ46_06400 [Acinetobacter baumannii]|nr:hypothetical protein [Acinetobacter baumannii]
MTVPISDRLSQLYVGNGTNTRFDFTFRIFQQEDLTGVAIRKKGNTDFETVDPSTYTVTLNADDMGGFVTFNTAPSKGTYFYIAGATPLDQLLDITNYDNFYPDAIERALDKLTALLQEWGTQLDLEKQARILADIHYDSLAMEREENLENRLISYINAVVGITNPKIFDGISDRMVITKDGRTQREFNESIPFWTDDYVNFKQQTIQREKKIIDYTDSEISKTNVALSNKIQTEKQRAEEAERLLELKISTSDLGIKFFETEAQVFAYVPGENDPKKAYAFDTKKNYMWVLKSGSTTEYQWKDEGLSSLSLANNYTNEQIKKLGFKVGPNIFDKHKVEIGKYYFWETGEKGNASLEYVAAGLYEIEGGVEYQVPTNYNQQFAFFDANKIYVDGQKNAGDTHKFTTPSNAKYIGLTVEVVQLDSFMLCKSIEYPADYTPYIIKNDLISVDAKLVHNLPSVIKEEVGINVVNIIDTTKVLNGKYIVWSNGFLGTNPDFVAAGPYEVKPNTEYQVSKNYDQQFAFYDENMVYVGGYVSPDVNKKFVTPANAKYIKLSIHKDILSFIVVAESAHFPALYEPYSITLKDLQLTPVQVLNSIDNIKAGLGFDIINIVDTNRVIQDSYINYLTGDVGRNVDFVATEACLIKPSTEYQTSSFYDQQFAFYDENMVYVDGFVSPDVNKKFVTPANAKYVRFSISKTQLPKIVVSESSIFPSEYVPHSVRLTKNLIVGGLENKATEIITSADTGAIDAVFTGKNAVQLALNSIADASSKNRYTIKTKGFHKVDVAKDVIGYPGYPSMILAKDHVDIVGDGKTVFWCELPHNDADIGPSADGNTYPRNRYQTLYSYAKDCLIKDVTFVVVNARYALHLDNPLGANATHNFEGVWFYFKGDVGSKQALGIGTSTGEKVYFKGGGSHSDSGQPLYCHNNVKFSDPSLVYFEGHKLSSNTSKLIGRIESDGSLLHDKMQFIGCSFGGTSYIFSYGEYRLRANPAQNYDSFDHSEWQLEGYGNDPFLFDNNVNGFCLRIKTAATGAGNTIRFDKASSAYPILIKNNQANTDVNLYVDSRDYLDGYIVQDGTVGLPALAFGCKDLGDTAADLERPTVYTSMGKRLGNCSSVNKSLGVIINGTTFTVTFNKDYTSMSNTAILAEINAALTGATADLYAYGRDYYPMMTDVAETVYNNTSSYIPKGSVVTKSKGTVKLANGNDKVFGVALDDIPVMSTTATGMTKGQGRVLKRGYISTDQNKAHYVLSDVSPAVGGKFKVENGQLISNINGTISVDIDDGVVSINC